MFDCHLHSYFSGDSNAKFEDIIKAALQNNLFGLVFTDHYEFEFPNPKYDFSFDVLKRADLIKEFQEKLSKDLILLCGVELGLQSKKLLEAESFLLENNFDCVIASVHSIDNQDFKPGLFEGKNQLDIFKKYLEEILFGVTNFKNYDIVGHIGYICRYVPQKYNTVFQDELAPLLDQILIQIINNKKALEVNTSGIRQNLGFTLPDYTILKRYFELGGRIITLGSDAHLAEHVGSKFKDVSKILKHIGFTEAVYFKDRKPISYPLIEIKKN